MIPDKVLAYLDRREGGLVDDPDDPGGRTNRGVTQKVYDGWRMGQHLGTQKVDFITDDEVRAIYTQLYWAPVSGDVLPPRVALVVFDAAVNQGVTYAKQVLQYCVKVPQDGELGPQTLKAVATADVSDLVNELIWQRMNRYRATCRLWQKQGKPNPWKFIDGWGTRLDVCRATAFSL